MLSCVGIGAVLSLAVAAGPSALSGAAKDVIAITKAEWAAAMAKNPSAQVANVAEDCTMFIPEFPNRLDGKTTIYNLVEAESGGVGDLVMAEMANEKVQVYGDVAILSYNYMGLGKDKEGSVNPTRAKSTRVYVKEGGQWWLVHANFAPTGIPNN
jgi:ketosteroid isomerase-like protein